MRLARSARRGWGGEEQMDIRQQNEQQNKTETKTKQQLTRKKRKYTLSGRNNRQVQRQMLYLIHGVGSGVRLGIKKRAY